MNYNISNDNITSRTDKDTLLRLRRTYNDESENKKISVTGKLAVKDGQPACFTLWDEDGNTASVYGEVPEKAVNVPLNPDDAAKLVTEEYQDLIAGQLAESICRILPELGK